MGKWEIYGLVVGMNGGRTGLCDRACCGWTKQGAGVGALCSPWAVGKGHCTPVARLETQRRLWPWKGGMALARAVCEDVGHWCELGQQRWSSAQKPRTPLGLDLFHRWW